MPGVKVITKKTARKRAKKVTLDDVWATINEIGKAHKETEAALKETQKAHTETEAAIQEMRKEMQTGHINLQRAHAETEEALKDAQKARAETEVAFKEMQIALKETQRIVGDLGNKFGDEAESTLVPGLQEKFKQFNFDFDTMSRNRKINNVAHDIRAEIDAFLENGAEAMAVEVKAKLQRADVDSHVKRMERLRRYADLRGDKRAYFGAMAATVVAEKERDYALENGFYVIEPSGEDVKVTKPESNPKIW
jgi:hypothetical protein